jgi:Na+/H+ antiporter NhaD/arsenite permease-like protein
MMMNIVVVASIYIEKKNERAREKKKKKKKKKTSHLTLHFLFFIAFFPFFLSLFLLHPFCTTESTSVCVCARARAILTIVVDGYGGRSDDRCIVLSGNDDGSGGRANVYAQLYIWLN